MEVLSQKCVTRTRPRVPEAPGGDTPQLTPREAGSQRDTQDSKPALLDRPPSSSGGTPPEEAGDDWLNPAGHGLPGVQLSISDKLARSRRTMEA